MTSPIYLPVWVNVLIQLYKAPEYKRYCQKMIREIKTSSNHLRAIVRLLAKEELIVITPTKKINHITVTDKGKRIALHMINVKSELGWP